MRFSVITSVYCWHELKQKQLIRAITSVQNQTFQDFEHIVIDDGSPVEFAPPLAEFRQPHLERIHALKEGMKRAKGEWFVFLDADDELVSYALEAINQMIEKNPKHKMFNFGSFHIDRNWSTRIRGPFEPKEEKVGHEMFGGGNIVNGTFVFHRDVYEKLGGFPDDTEEIDTTDINYGGVRSLHMTSPFDFSAMAQLEFPEIRQYFMIDHEAEPNKVIKELGNPWGQDYYLFYKYTRKYHSKAYNIPLYIVHHEGKMDGEGHEI